MIYYAISQTLKVGAETTLKDATRPISDIFQHSGNYDNYDLKIMQMKMGFLNVGKTGSTSSNEAMDTIDFINAGLASEFIGTATSLTATKKNANSDKTTLAIKTAATCTYPTEQVCIDN